MLYPFHCWAAIIKYSGVDVACREEKMTSSAISNFVIAMHLPLRRVTCQIAIINCE